MPLRRFPPPWSVGLLLAMRNKKTLMGGLVALCALALLVQHVLEPDPNYTVAHLIAGLVMLMVAVIVWCVPTGSSNNG
jgi:uncharacterized membrane protein